MAEPPLLLNSITDAGASAAGRVVVSGSHGGLYPAAVASRAGVRAVVFNDAGIGLARAGVAGVLALASVGMAAAAADCMSCLIGSADDMLARGAISVVNDAAAALGVAPGVPVAEACARLAAAPPPRAALAPVAEARRETVLCGWPAALLDSASLVGPEDEGGVVVTGSHGGLIGGDPARALKAKAWFAAFNDAGFGKDRIGVSRLPALDARGVAAVTVSHRTARIGDAASTLETGVVSAANEAARALGLEAGRPLRAALIDALSRRPKTR